MSHLTAQLQHPGPLTPKEAEVLCFLCEGKAMAEIARLRHRSLHTIRTHVESIAGKLHAHSSAEIVCKAVAKGMVSISLRTLLLCWLSFGVTVNDHVDKRRTHHFRNRSAERSISRTRLDS